MGPARTGVHSVARRENDNDLSKKAKRNEADGKAQNERRKARPTQNG
jgi:hypothetical protein